MKAKEAIKKLLKSHFIRAFTSIFGGTAIAQVLNFLFQPVVTRLYSVEQYGEYAVYTSILTVASVVVTLAYEQAVIASKDKKEAQSLIFGTIYISLFFCVLSFLFILFFKSTILGWLKLDTCDWLYILPINLFFLTTYNLFASYHYVIEKYKRIGLIACIRSFVMGASQILFYYLGLGMKGLPMGRIVAITICSIILCHSIIRSRIDYSCARLHVVLICLKHHYQFPAFQLPASFVNHFLDSAITFVILALYSRVELGYYSLVVQILSIPISMISSSLRSLSISEFTKISNDYQQSRSLFIRLALGMFVVITIPMVIAFFWGEPIFTFVFGSKWNGAGVFIKALVPLYILKFVAFPLSSIAIVQKKQSIFLAFQTSLIVLTFLVYGCASILHLGSIQFFVTLSLSMTALYVFQIIVYYNMIKHGGKNND